MDKAKFERVMGIIGTVTAVLMYVFYINTIRNYLNAAPGTEKGEGLVATGHGLCQLLYLGRLWIV